MLLFSKYRFDVFDKFRLSFCALLRHFKDALAMGR
jgi:hypothetical protein